VSEAYYDYLDQLSDKANPFRILVLQLSLIAYLALGQLVLLLLWRLLRGAVVGMWPGLASWRRLGGVVFAFYLLGFQVVLFAAWPPLVSAWLSARPILLADLVVTAHLGLVIAVLLALLLVLVGWWRGWSWTRNFWFRVAHLIIIEVVAGQAFLLIECPLTTVERHYRGGKYHLHDTEESSAIGRFANETLYVSIVADPAKPPWAMVAGYAGFTLLVVLTWVLAPPRLPWQRSPPP
jgi:hypothetical protein